jgi:predicted dienelactone hydrolase
MRFLEILILAALFINLFGYLIPRVKRPRALTYLPFLTVLLVVIHLLVERPRWQMVPAYLWCLLVLVISLLQLRRPSIEQRPPSRRVFRIAAFVGKLVVLFVFLLTAAIPWLFPVVDLPQPTGPYAVGTIALDLVDPDRPEAFTDDPGDVRELMVRVWYPAEPAPDARPMPYWPDADVIGPIRVSDDFHKWGLTFLPTAMFNHFDLMKTNSYPGAPISDGAPSYPVVLFSPGGGVVHERNFLHVEELASHGYVVLSLSAPYESWAVVFPDGRVVRGKFLKAKEEPTEKDEERQKKGQDIVERFQASTDIQERKAIMRELFALDPDGIMDRLLETRVADVRFVLDELERMETGAVEGPLTGRLDLEHVGIFGMSLGGAVAGQACLEDQRLRAGINLDGTQFGTVIDGWIDQPFMYMNSGTSKDHNDFVYDRLRNMGYSVTVAGSSHMDFTDFFYTIPAFKALAKDAIPNEQMYRIVNAYTVAFFDRYLKGEQEPLLTPPSDAFPEVTFKIVSRPRESASGVEDDADGGAEPERSGVTTE